MKKCPKCHKYTLKKGVLNPHNSYCLNCSYQTWWTTLSYTSYYRVYLYYKMGYYALKRDNMRQYTEKYHKILKNITTVSINW